ncbi:DUF2283 domain-containing protein [Candidatus Woesearchaeota archaeon]|nr:DUF2283 domain-containing protein [Candidatus Woesearchaeota archaeon]
MATTEMKYEGKEDILYVYRPGKVKVSIDLDSVVLDVDREGRIIGVQFNDASQTFAKPKGHAQSVRELLAAARGATMSVAYRANTAVIRVAVELARSLEMPAMVIAPMNRAMLAEA